jgi:type 1 glutamine amidotransferase
MLGGELDFHGPETAAEVWVEDAAHPATGAIESPMTLFEEYYHIKRFDPAAVHLLLALRFDPDAGQPAMMPLSWWRDYGRGRVFYTALGHREDVWQSPWFQQHLTGALAWAVAREPGSRRRAVRR